MHHRFAVIIENVKLYEVDSSCETTQNNRGLVLEVFIQYFTSKTHNDLSYFHHICFFACAIFST